MITTWEGLRENNFQKLIEAAIYIRDNQVGAITSIESTRETIERTLQIKFEIFLEVLLMYNMI